MSAGRPTIAALCAALCVAIAAAAPAGAQPVRPPPSAEKLKLIRELLALSGSNEMGHEMANWVLRELQRSYEPIVELVVTEERDLTDDQRIALAERLSDFDVFAEKFRARFESRLKVPDLVASVWEPLFHDAFSEDELQQMVGFYRTPVGQKAIVVMPALMAQAQQDAYRVIQPYVTKLIGEIVKEERAALGE